MGIYYWNLISISLMGFLFSNKKMKKSRLELVCYVIAWLQVCIISAIRYDVGTDYGTYCAIFRSIRNAESLMAAILLSPVEIGYTTLNYFFGIFTDNFVWVSGFCALITVTFFFVAIRRYSFNPWFSLILFIALGNLYISYNTIRQMLACSIMFFGWKFVQRKKYMYFILLVLFAASFHTPVLVMIPISIILNVNLNIKRLFFISVVMSISIVVLPYMIQYITILFPKYRIYLGTLDFMPGWNLKSTAVWLFIFGVLYIFYPYYKNKISYARQLTNFSYFAFAFSLLQGGVSIISRVVPYCSIFAIISLPSLLNAFSSPRQKRFVFWGIIFFVFLYHSYQLYVGNSGVVPYNSIF